MGSAKVITQEIDQSTTVPSFPGVYGGIVVTAKKGPVNEPILCTSDVDFLKKYTPNERVEVGYDNAYFSALAHLGKSDKLWVVRAANSAKFAGLVLRTIVSSYSNHTLSVGLVDPTAYVFDSTPDVPAIREAFTTLMIGDGSTFDVSGAAKSLSFTVLPTAEHYLWFEVTGGSNTQADPGLTGTPHKVTILNGDTAAQIAVKAAAIIAGITGILSSSVLSATITTTLSTAGAVTAPSAGSSGATVIVTTVGADAITTLDESMLIYESSPGIWGNDIGIKLTTYSANPDRVKEPGAFIIDVFKSSNLASPIESHLCSRDESHRDGFGRNIYVQTVLEGSSYIRAIDNVAFLSTVYPKDQSTIMMLAGGDDGSAVSDSQIITALDTLRNKDFYPLTTLMDGGHTSPAVQQEMDTIANYRQDCVAIDSVPYSAEANVNYMDEIINYRKTDLNLNSSYSVLYTPHIKIYDKFNDRQLFVSPDGFASAAISNTAATSEIWFPPAGFKRGMINALETRRKFDSGERDLLYDNQINPIRFVPGKGIAIWGQKTLLSRPSALQSLHIRLLLNVIEPAIASFLEYFLFELNDEDTRFEAKSKVDTYLENVKSRKGVKEFRNICDLTNNSDADIDANRMILDSYIKPIRDVEEIVYRTIITSSGANLSTI